MSNSTWFGIIGVVALIAGVAFGYTIWHEESEPTPQEVATGTSATGSTFQTAKIAETVMAPTSISATTSSILNGDASDRIITDGGVYCEGATGPVFGQTSVAAWLLTAATSSTNAPAEGIATAAFPALKITIATGTAKVFVATSTYPLVWGQIWTTGTYLTFQFNATSSSASCTPYVHYIAQ